MSGDQRGAFELGYAGTLLESKANDVLLCRGQKRGGQETGEYILWRVKDREVIKYLLSEAVRGVYLDYFSCGEGIGFLFPAEGKRPFHKFWNPEEHDRRERKEMCRRIVALCMEERLPERILYLMLEQKALNIRKDGTLYFTFDLYLGALRVPRTEEDCVRLCARMCIDTAGQEEPGRGKGRDRFAELAGKKLARGGYHTFSGLYKDLEEPVCRGRRKKLWQAVPEGLGQRGFSAVSVILTVLVVLVLVMGIVQLIFGEIPFMHIFSESFGTIGTEALRWIVGGGLGWAG